jgi:hypothetical protein
VTAPARGLASARLLFWDVLMTLCLRAGLSFCDVGGRLIFLDVNADRYFCLSKAVENGFRRACAGADLEIGEEARLAELIQRGILRRSGGTELVACAPLAVPTISLLQASRRPPVGRCHAVSATMSVIVALLRLRLLPLRASLRRRGTRASAAALSSEQQARLANIARAFDSAGRLVSAHDRCLARSVAVARAAWRAGVPVDLVLGVALGPFTAHCWVQCGGVVVNDSVDTVLTYTPILIV